jgi:hypothetical protein
MIGEFKVLNYMEKKNEKFNSDEGGEKCMQKSP